MKKIKQFFKEKPILAFVLVLVLINVLLGIGAFVYASTTSNEQAKNESSDEETTPKPTKKKSPSPKPTTPDEEDTEDESEDESETTDDEEGTDTLSPTPEDEEEPTASPTPANQKNINLFGDIFADKNCNGSKDDGEEILGLETTINLYKLPGNEAYDATKTNRNGHYSYSSTIDADSEVELQPSAVPPSGYMNTPGFEAKSVTFSNNNASGQVLIPLVPEENKDSCTEDDE